VVRRTVLLLGAVFVAACAPTGSGGSREAPSVSPSSAASFKLTRQLAYTPHTVVAQLKMWANTAAWIVTPGAGQKNTGERIEVLDLRTRAERTIATLPYDHPLSSMTGDGNLVIYVALMGRPTDQAPLVNWQMNAVNLVDGTTTTLAASTGPVHYLLVPSPTLRSPWLAWAEPIPVPLGQRVDSKVIAENMQTQQRVVLESASGASQIAIVHSVAVYDTGRAPDYRSHDIYARPLTGSASAVRLTNNGSSKNPVGSDSWVTWEQPGTEGTAILASRISASTGRFGTPVEIDPSSQGGAKVGDGFVIWLASNALTFQPLATAGVAHQTVLEQLDTLDQGGSWDVYGNRIAWVTHTTTGSQQIIVDAVTS
jgi:hypothetical protein